MWSLLSDTRSDKDVRLVLLHCYGSRANLGPVSYGERENLRSIQENLD